MASHIGIELSPGVCRIVDLDLPRSGGSTRAKRVRRFAVLARDSEEMQAALDGLRGRAASVVVWGVPGDHRQVMVTAGSYDSMRREARRALTLAGVETRGTLIDIARAAAPGVEDGDGARRRRPVVVALANGAAVADALRPLRASGIRVHTVATPATALASMARAHRSLCASESGAAAASGDGVVVDAWVALEDFATCIALLRDGSLVAARELSWGFRVGRRGDLRAGDEVAIRFADELAEFMMTVGGTLHSVRQITLCGGAPELRQIGALLTERCALAVETLDAPFGVEADLHPFVRDRCADMWMAWSVAVDRPAPLSLLHAQQIKAAQLRFARAAVAAGILAGVGLGWEAAHCPLLRAESFRQPRHGPVQTAPDRPAGVRIVTVRVEEQGATKDR